MNRQAARNALLQLPGVGIRNTRTGANLSGISAVAPRTPTAIRLSDNEWRLQVRNEDVLASSVKDLLSKPDNGDLVQVDLLDKGLIVFTQFYQINADILKNFKTEHTWAWSDYEGENHHNGDLLRMKVLKRTERRQAIRNETVLRDGECFYNMLLHYNETDKKNPIKKSNLKYVRNIISENNGIPTEMVPEIMTKLNRRLEIYITNMRSNPILKFGPPLKRNKNGKIVLPRLIKAILRPGKEDSHIELMTDLNIIDWNVTPVDLSQLEIHFQQKKLNKGYVGNYKIEPVQRSAREYFDEFVKRNKLTPIHGACYKRMMDWRTVGGCHDYHPEQVEKYRYKSKEELNLEYINVDMINAVKNHYKVQFYTAMPINPRPYIKCTELRGPGIYDVKIIDRPANEYVDLICSANVLNDVQIKTFRHLGYTIEIVGGIIGENTIDRIVFPEEKINGIAGYCLMYGFLSMTRNTIYTVMNGPDNYSDYIKDLIPNRESYHTEDGILFVETKRLETYCYWSTYIQQCISAENALQYNFLNKSLLDRTHTDGNYTRERNPKLLDTFKIDKVKSFKFYANNLHQSRPHVSKEDVDIFTENSIVLAKGVAGSGRTTFGFSLGGNILYLGTSKSLVYEKQKKYPNSKCRCYQGFLSKEFKTYKEFMKDPDWAWVVIIDESLLIESVHLQKLLRLFQDKKIYVVAGTQQTIIWKGLPFDWNSVKNLKTIHFDNHYRLGNTEQERMNNPLTKYVNLFLDNEECQGSCQTCATFRNNIPSEFGTLSINNGVYIFRQNSDKNTPTSKKIKAFSNKHGLKVTTVESLQGEDNNSEMYNICVDKMDCRHLYTALTRSGNINKYNLFKLTDIS